MGAKFRERGQGDLFEHFQAADSDKKIRKKTRSLLPRLTKSITLSYENIIFFVIGFVMSCIIFFSLGVEKGRQDIKQAGTENRVRGTAAQRSPQQGRGERRIEKTTQQTQEGYIILLASFKKRGSAEKELTRLKKEGYKAGIKKSGQYHQLYIGGFTEKKKAQDMLKRLDARYKDCYIKRL